MMFSLGLPAKNRPVLSKAHQRLQSAFRQSTAKAYTAKLWIFIAFCIFAQFPMFHLTTSHVLVFLEFLVFNGTSTASIANYLSAIKAKLSMYAVDVSPFVHPQIKYFTRSLTLSAPLKISLKAVIDLHTLKAIVRKCDTMYMGQIFKSAFLLSFFSFLRISNLVPHSMHTFNPLQQLARADIFFAPPGAHILIKWSKTLQSKNHVRLLKIPSLNNSPLCPVAAIKNLLLITPSGDNKPLFQIKYRQIWVPLTDSRLRRALSSILLSLQLHKSKITFHSFRRSGATLAFNSSVPLQDIQSHGTWSSDCVWSYITQDHNATDRVAVTFQSLLSN